MKTRNKISISINIKGQNNMIKLRHVIWEVILKAVLSCSNEGCRDYIDEIIADY